MRVVQESADCGRGEILARRPLPSIFLAMERYHSRRYINTSDLEGSICNGMSPVSSLERLAAADGNSTPELNPAVARCKSKSFELSKGVLTLDSVYALKNDMLTKGYLSHISITNMAVANSEQSKDIQRLLVEAWQQQQQHIKSVDLSNCGLDDEIALQFASSIAEPISVLESLNLSGNKITDVGAAALAAVLSSRQCRLKELDLSNTLLSRTGILSFCENIGTYQHLRVLRLRDSEHLLPVSVFQTFAAQMEKNHVLRTLTMGSESMDGFVDPMTNKAEKEMDAVLRYFWQEPAYTAATDHIRNLLRLNCSGLEAFLQTSNANSDMLRVMLDTVDVKHEADACYRILQLKPDLVAALCLPSIR